MANCKAGTVGAGQARSAQARSADAAAWIDKRRIRWAEKLAGEGYRAAIEYDRRIVDSAAYAILTDERLRAEVTARPWLLIEMCFTVVDKNQRLVPFFLNPVQQDFIRLLEEHGGGRPYYILKGRQQGFTTLITAIQTAFSILRRNFSGFTLSHRADSTAAIFNDKARQTLARLPELLRPHEKFNSRNEIFFDKLGSSWRCATATDEVGRSATLNFVHFSEAAFYECQLSKLQAGILNACTADAIVIYETTANGYGEAKDLWDSGTCINVFVPWYRSAEYRREGSYYRDKLAGDGWLTERLGVLSSLGLDDAQLEWYAWKYDSYIDKRMIRQEYPITAEEAFLASGYGVFDNEALANRLAQVERLPCRVGKFVYRRVGQPVRGEDGEVEAVEWRLENVRFEESPGGLIRIHEEPRVRRDGQGHVIGEAPYVLGGDTAGEGSDYYTGKILDVMTGHVAATLRIQRIDEDEYAEQMLCLARYYHEALIGIEINFSMLPMTVIMRKYGYSHVYMREAYDDVTRKVSTKPGWLTSATTKPLIVGELVEAVRECPQMEADPETIREMMTFVKSTTGTGRDTYGAAEGSHDDLVMALAIANHIRAQAPASWQEVKLPEDDLLERFLGKDRMDEQEKYMDWGDI